MTPAEEIKQAADKLKALTGDATEGPWHSENPNTRWGDDHDHDIIGGGKILATFSNDHNGPLNADYAAAMHPGVGALLAKWLESAEEDARQIGPDPHALAVARAINAQS
ncbi:hypothetical protein [Streptomyces capoamus]|uniref:hypothetical protein n=1 Tax=Streptomyces capoamus TaxID=68183 RepID=UPI003394DF27